MDWFLYDNGLRHERVKRSISNLLKFETFIKKVPMSSNQPSIDDNITEAATGGVLHKKVKND